MNKTSRRDSIKTLGAASLGVSASLLGLGASGLQCWADEKEGSTAHTEIEVDLARWIAHLNRNAKGLRENKKSPLQWQEMMDEIYKATPLQDLVNHLSFKSLSTRLIDKIPADRMEYFHRINLSDPTKKFGNAKETEKTLITKVAYIRKGHSIPPHGHSNMVSAFLCLSGEFEVHLFDRLDDRENEMVVRRSRHQKSAKKGTWSSISDYRDNVHWLTAKTDDCFLFTSKLINIEKGLPLKGRINIDVKRGKEIGTDTLIAPKITSNQARELY